MNYWKYYPTSTKNPWESYFEDPNFGFACGSKGAHRSMPLVLPSRPL